MKASKGARDVLSTDIPRLFFSPLLLPFWRRKTYVPNINQQPYGRWWPRPKEGDDREELRLSAEIISNAIGEVGPTEVGTLEFASPAV